MTRNPTITAGKRLDRGDGDATEAVSLMGATCPSAADRRFPGARDA